MANSIGENFRQSVNQLAIKDSVVLAQVELVHRASSAAINATAAATVGQIAQGVITSTSAAGTTITLPTVAALVAAFPDIKAGSTLDFEIDNSGGASTVTVAVGTGIVANKQVSSGDTAVDVLLTVAASATIGVGRFQIYFISTTAAVLNRIW